MDTMTAFSMGEANRDKELMVFDWEKAARLIKEKDAKEASAGLSNDWACTGGEILADGQTVPEYKANVCLASTWATPELKIDGDVFDCYKMQSETPGWDSDTYWPKEALEILKSN